MNDSTKENNLYRSIQDNPALEQASQLNTRHKDQITKSVDPQKARKSLWSKPTGKAKDSDKYVVLQSDKISAQVTYSLGPAEAKMLDYINYQATKTANSIKDGKVHISAEEYAKDNGLKFTNGKEKYPKQKARKLLFDLVNFKYSFNDGNENNKYKYPVKMMTPIPEYDTSKHGEIIVGLSPTYQEMLTKHAFYTPIPLELFHLDPVHQAVAYAIGRYLCHNKRANADKESHQFGDVVKIDTLLNHCKGAFPNPYTTRRFKQQIYEPFMRAVGEDLVGVFDFEFLDSKGMPTMLTDPTRKEFLESALVVTNWHGYPYDKVKEIVERHKKEIANHKRSRTLKNKK